MSEHDKAVEFWEREEPQQPCEICGCEERTALGTLTCKCPAPLDPDPDLLREDRDERRRLEREFPNVEDDQ